MIVRVALRETDHRVALAQGLVVGPAIWGVVVNLAMYALPGIPGAIAGWIFVLALAAVLVWRFAEIGPPAAAHGGGVQPHGTRHLLGGARQQAAPVGDRRDSIHLGLAASIRAGGFPPELPWNPGTPAPYHYGVRSAERPAGPAVGPGPRVRA